MMILGLLQRRHNRPMGPTLKKAALDLYTDWILDSGSPLNPSDNEKFKKFLAFLDPEVTIPGRNDITSLLDKK